MDSYLLILGFGFVGLLIMAVLGVAGGHGHHHAHGADGFHLHGTGQHGLSAPTNPQFHHTPVAQAPHSNISHVVGGHSHSANSSRAGTSSAATMRGALVGWLSPRVAFTFALGFGATGALLQTALPATGCLLASMGGGIALEKIVVAPLWKALMGFGSLPARTLESALFEEARAVTNFDGDGCGLIAIDLGGHEVQVLGRLIPESRGDLVRAGTRLLVEGVDAARGSCSVSPLQLPT